MFMKVHLLLLGCYMWSFALPTKIRVPVFSNFLLPCNITELPQSPNRSQFRWFKDNQLLAGIENFLAPNGQIVFELVDRTAQGHYLCCYGGNIMQSCSNEVSLTVEVPRAEIFASAVLNITPAIVPGNVYWLPEMLVTPQEADVNNQLVQFSCYYFARYVGTVPPNVTWEFNQQSSLDRRFDRVVRSSNYSLHRLQTEEFTCREEFLNTDRDHCFKSTLTVRVKDPSSHPHTVYVCNVATPTNRLDVDYQLTYENSTSVWTTGFDNIHRQNHGCENMTDSGELDDLLQASNACQRNGYLRMWVSALGQNNSVFARCHRPFYLSFLAHLEVRRLPPDATKVKEFIDARWRLTERDSAVPDIGAENSLLMGDALDLVGNLTLDCETYGPRNVIACVYGPILQMELIQTNCSVSKTFQCTSSACISGLSVGFAVYVASVLLVTLWIYKKRRDSSDAVWKILETCTKTLFEEQLKANTPRAAQPRRLRTPPLPPPPSLTAEEAGEYVKLDRSRWPLSGKSVQVGNLIATGSYGDIYKGTLSLGDKRGECRHVVIKTLKDILSKDHIMEFATEVAILRLVGRRPHPNIIDFFGCAQRSTLNSHPVLVTEFAPNGDLCTYLRAIGTRLQGVDDVRDVVRAYWWTRARDLISDLFSFSFDVANALLYLENISVIHGDVACRNVLLSASFTAKLNDFELSCVTPNGKYADLPPNSRLPVRWSAVEVLRDRRRHARSDVWAFGVLLWEAFSLGTRPFDHLDTEAEVTDFVVLEGGRMGLPDYATSELYDLMKACWAQDVEDRPDFVAVLKRLKAASELRVEASPNVGGTVEGGDDVVGYCAAISGFMGVFARRFL